MSSALRYAVFPGDVKGVDLVADNPVASSRSRRINGDAPAREGLARVLIWAALFRHWSLRDWVALAEVGWKHWRVAKYDQGKLSQAAIDKLADMLERIGNQGVAVVPKDADIEITWPGGSDARATSVTPRSRPVLDR